MDRTVCGDCGAPMELCDCKSFFRAKEVKRMRAEIERLRAIIEAAAADFEAAKVQVLADHYRAALRGEEG